MPAPTPLSFCCSTRHTSNVRPPKNGPTIQSLHIFCYFLSPGPVPEASISRQKCRIWMRIWRVTAIFVVFEKFAFVLRRFWYIWPLAGPNIGFIGIWKAVSCLKLTSEKAGIGLRRENFGFPEPKKHWNPEFLDFRANLWILNKNCRSSSFTRPVGLIIDSIRSGTCFSSCLVSSIFFHKKHVSFSSGQLWWTHHFHFLQPLSRSCSIEKVYPREWRIAIPASLMRVDKRPNNQKPSGFYYFLAFFHTFGP